MSFVLYSGVYSLFTPKMNEFCVVFRCLFPFYTQNELVLCKYIHIYNTYILCKMHTYIQTIHVNIVIIIVYILVKTKHTCVGVC